MSEYKLPDVGEGLTEAEIVSWKVEVGDLVEINDVIVEIETAKSLVELPSPFAGTVLELMVAEGETVPVGTPIISIGEGSPVVEEGRQGAGSPVVEEGRQGPSRNPHRDLGEIDLSNPAASGGGEGESLVGRMKAERGPMRRPRTGSASPSPESAAATQMQVQGAFAPGGAQSQDVIEAEEPAVPASAARPRPPEQHRALAKPPVRKLAKELGLDLGSVTPTGPHGTVSRADVEAAAAGAQTQPPTMPQSYADRGAPGVHPMSGARETREPIKGVRKAMGEAMVASAFTIPHVTEWITVDVTRTMKLIDRLQQRPEFHQVKVTVMAVLCRAVISALRRTPQINAWWDEDAQEVLYRGYVNLGIAAATPRGLVVPNIKDADTLDLVQLAAELGELTETARAGKTQPAAMAGGTFTVTNVGVFGVDAGTPIINPGESAILAIGAIRPRPWVHRDKIKVRQVATLALSFDHRHIDGAAGSRFLADVAGLLHDPALLMLR